MIGIIRKSFTWAMADAVYRGRCPLEGDDLVRMVGFKDWYVLYALVDRDSPLPIAELILRNSDEELERLWAMFVIEREE